MQVLVEKLIVQLEKLIATQQLYDLDERLLVLEGDLILSEMGFGKYLD